PLLSAPSGCPATEATMPSSVAGAAGSTTGAGAASPAISQHDSAAAGAALAIGSTAQHAGTSASFAATVTTFASATAPPTGQHEASASPASCRRPAVWTSPTRSAETASDPASPQPTSVTQTSTPDITSHFMDDLNTVVSP